VRSRQASASATAELFALADIYGVQAAYGGEDGTRHRADEDTVLAILQALGAPLGSPAHAAAALAAHRQEKARRHLEPILVHHVGRPGSTTLTLPRSVHPRQVWCTIELEDGDVRRQSLSGSITNMAVGAASPGPAQSTYRFSLEPDPSRPIPPGYHQVIVEWPGARATALLLAAPPCPDPSRGWGVFLPLHALRTDNDWGVGSYTDLCDLGEWMAELGASMLGALPLYPAFLDPPADPSPYLPVSRLAYNEVFVDPTSLPELTQSPEARQLLDSDAFRRRLSSAHHAALVDYEEVARLRRQVLAPMAEVLLGRPSTRHDELTAFTDRHPELLAYARFRADLDARGPDSGQSDHDARGARGPREHPSSFGYHLYAQWAAAEQLTVAASTARLYADLPIGVHPDGFDPLWAPKVFVTGVHGGAPPDLFFEGGQDWSFPPLHPERVREDGYRYFIDIVRRAFRHASYLRVDHVMGLQRLYWIPEGFDARHGAYVSYRADELHAVVSLEAHRAGTVVVGEDLGTVPAGVRERMTRDHMLRSWVLQFESTAEDPLPAPPAAVMASWGTHDLARFGAYFWGLDIDQNEGAGQLTAQEATTQREERERWRTAMTAASGATGETGESADPADSANLATTVLRRCLAHLAQSEAELVMVDLEELWGERQPQNRPGTGTEAANWRRRASHTLEEARKDNETNEFLRQLNGLRHRVAPTDRVAVRP
jgi:4-alpha-glucanotransferase